MVARGLDGKLLGEPPDRQGKLDPGSGTGQHGSNSGGDGDRVTTLGWHADQARGYGTVIGVDEDLGTTALATAVVRAQSGDVPAFETLYRDVQPRLVRYLATLVGADAPDVASETWLQVARDLPTFRGDQPAFRAWVVGIGRHRALDHLRAHRRRPADPCDPALLPEAAGQTDLDEGLATRRALALINRLPPDQAEAVLLRIVVGLDAPAAAKVLGKRPGAVRMATSRGLATLRDLVGVTPEKATALTQS